MTGEQRMNYRLGGSESFFIEYQNTGPQEPSKMLLCHSVDLSANGLKVRVGKDLPINAIYAISVETDALEAPLTLAGQVRWRSPIADSDEYFYGIELLESDDTDIAQWKLYVAKQLLKADNLYD